MTKYETRIWLNRGWKLNEQINKKLEILYNALNLACGTTPCGNEEKVQTSNRNSTENKIARYLDISNEVNKLTDELYEIRKETWHVINQCTNSLYKRVLKLRFVYFKSWGYIARRVNKPSSTVRGRILSKAISSIAQYIA